MVSIRRGSAVISKKPLMLEFNLDIDTVSFDTIILPCIFTSTRR
jgi:hypothetical protein